MSFLKQFASSPNQKPGNRFFATVILIGIVALIVIWLMEKPAVQKPEPEKKKVSKTVVKTSKTAEPLPVLVMTKTNLPPAQTTNVAAISQTITQAVIATPNAIVTPTNRVRGNNFSARSVQNIFEAQLAMARLGISAGSIDGVNGSQTRAAVRAFQQSRRLPVTGELDPLTKSKLLLTESPYTEFSITTNELARIQPLGTSWSSKARQTRLDYETILELVAEKFCCHPNFLKQLNPSINWTNAANVTVRVPNIEKVKPESSAAFVRVRLSEKSLVAFDAATNLIAHFPCSIARRIEKRPVGELRVEKVAENPDYTFNPENFSESAEARSLKTKLILSPGPNNPVGTVWIGLNKPGYGIHGTPAPEQVGRTESHGCFRLANWNAEHLIQLVRIGMPVIVEP